MAFRERESGVLFGMLRPHLLMALVQMAVSLLHFFISWYRLHSTNGINPHLFVTSACCSRYCTVSSYVLERYILYPSSRLHQCFYCLDSLHSKNKSRTTYILKLFHNALTLSKRLNYAIVCEVYYLLKEWDWCETIWMYN